MQLVSRVYRMKEIVWKINLRMLQLEFENAKKDIKRKFNSIAAESELKCVKGAVIFFSFCVLWKHSGQYGQL